MEKEIKLRARHLLGALSFVIATTLFVPAVVSSQPKSERSRVTENCETRYSKGKPYLYCGQEVLQKKRRGFRARTSIGAREGLSTKRRIGVGTSNPSSPLKITRNSRLKALRALIEQSEIPPRDVAGYGIVAFTSLPLSTDRQRFLFVCEAFKAALIPREDLPANTPLSEQIVTFWPVKNKHAPEAIKADCNYLVSSYELQTALDAVNDADKQKESLAQRRGPFLVAWSPSQSRYEKDSLVLVFDLSNIEGQQSFLEIFKSWRQKIIDNPELWKKGFDVEAIRQTIRGILDRYGESILHFIKGS